MKKLELLILNQAWISLSPVAKSFSIRWLYSGPCDVDGYLSPAPVDRHQSPVGTFLGSVSGEVEGPHGALSPELDLPGCSKDRFSEGRWEGHLLLLLALALSLRSSFAPIQAHIAPFPRLSQSG